MYRNGFLVLLANRKVKALLKESRVPAKGIPAFNILNI